MRSSPACAGRLAAVRRGATIGLAAALALVGCGGANGGRLSRNQLISQGDALCLEQFKTEQRIGAFRDVRTLARKGDQELTADRAGLARFAKLRPPSKLQSAFDDYLTLLRKALDVEADLVDAAKKGDIRRLRRANVASQALRPRLTTAAQNVGFGFCSQANH
jgi:hypothetical protein